MTRRSTTLKQFPQLLRELPDKFNEAAIRGLRSAGARLIGFTAESITDTSPYPPIATGAMAGSVRSFPLDDGAIVRVMAPHAAFMEEGTRPHYPPLQPLRDWVVVKGLASDEDEVERIARAVAAKIARDGIAPRHFFARAVNRLETEQVIPNEIAHEFNRIEG